jgi:hypothetical protein
MTSIREFAYATLLAVTALNFAPSLASAQEPAHGKFTLTHDVRWENAKVLAGDYEFSFDPDAASHVMHLTKLSGTRAGFLLLVPNTEDAKPTDQSRLILETTPDGSYVSTMQLPEFGMTLNFTVPAHTEKQIAKAATTASAAAR